tara:strand:- start:52 stop:1101 length:1050 start_codon:yes stop_codon:yes gene_type:complete
MAKKNSYTLLQIRIMFCIFIKGKISFKKIFNFLYGKIAHKLKLRKSARFPFMIIFELWNECNAQCTFCRTADGKIHNLTPNSSVTHIEKGRMPLSTYQAVIDQVKDHLIIGVLYINGEPLMYKELGKALRYATDRKVASLIATNGELLSEPKIKELLDSGLDVIKIAISGFTQEIYQVQHRNCHIEKVKDNLRTLAHLKKALGYDIVVVLDYIIYEYNDHEKELARQFSEELGFIFNLRRGNHYKLDEEHPDLMPKHIPEAPTLPMKNLCEWPWQVMTIDWNGNIFQCCEYVVRSGGEPYTTFQPEQSNLAEIWNGPIAAKHREIHSTEGRGGIDVCSQCPRVGTAFKY